MPYKRWHVTLSGDWEDGWEAEATSRLAGGEGSVAVSTNESGWFHDPGGHRDMAAALRSLAAKLRESR
jgi:hypothetical protein